ncbi:MAG: hypothetical protein N4A72_17230 [Bacteroidales bacterium]|nr:hypothetical protein [Bacteroidales bacterium]
MQKLNKSILLLNSNQLESVKGGNIKYVPICYCDDIEPVWNCSTCWYKKRCTNPYYR